MILLEKIRQQEFINWLLAQNGKKKNWKHNLTQRDTQASELAAQSQRNEEIEGQQSSLPKNSSEEDVQSDLMFQDLLAWMVDQIEHCQLRSHGKFGSPQPRERRYAEGTLISDYMILLEKIRQQEFINWLLAQNGKKKNWKHNLTQRDTQASELAAKSQRNEETEGQQSSLPKNSSEEDVQSDLMFQELLAWMVDQIEHCQLRSHGKFGSTQSRERRYAEGTLISDYMILLEKIRQQEFINWLLAQNGKKKNWKHNLTQRDIQASELAAQSQRNEEIEGQQRDSELD
ncbi:hypothetical protein STEG23_007958 [Scotinomys teguina]